MTGLPLLSLMTFLPLVGVALILLIKNEGAAKHIALWTSLVVFALAGVMLAQFDGTTAAYQFTEKAVWFKPLGLSYHMGVDGISMFFVFLSAMLTPVCVLASWRAIEKRPREFMAAFLVLETFMIGTFCALDTVLFYVFFEGVLLPMFIIIGVWGGKNRVYASYKFFLYTLLGSILMLLAIMWMGMTIGTDIPTLIAQAPNQIPPDIQKWLWLAFFASFAVKMPMWPVHTWLPDAHVEAPTAGSVILAGVLLKMGGYGFLRFSLPMFPDASEFFAPMVFGLSIVAVIYTSLVALVQEDMKKLIAYSSVAHMGFVTIGIFAANTQGVEGAMYQMLSHGVVSGALFLCVGVVYDRLHTREIGRYGGIVNNMPIFAVLMMVFTMASIGLPGTSGFVGEFLVLVGAFKVDTVVATLAALGMILGAGYMLLLYRRMIFGEAVNADAAAMKDVNRRELLVLVPLALMMIWLGVLPQSVISRITPSTQKLLNDYHAALADNAPAPVSVPAAPQEGTP